MANWYIGEGTVFFSLEGLLILVGVVTLALNVLHVIRPIPNGWDEFVRYVNTPHLLASTGELISGINAYPFELIMSLGFILFHSTPIALGLSTVMSVLAAGTLFLVAQEFVSKRWSFIVSVLFYITPMVIFQSSREIKVDLAATFFTFVSIFALMHWWKSNHRNWLLIAGLLAGTAFTIKYTVLLFLLAVIVALFYALRAKRYCWKHVITSMLLFGLWSIPVYIPWGIYFMAGTDALTTQTLIHGTSETPQAVCFDNPEQAVAIAAPTETPAPPTQRTGTTEELGRYLGYGTPVMRYVLAPWTITMNTVVKGLNVDIGFLFLALIPALGVFVTRTPPGVSREARTRWKFIGIFTIVYWLLWLIFAQGVIWYGLPGFLGLFVILAGLLTQKPLPQYLRTVSIVAIVLFTSAVGMFRIVSAVPSLQLAYIAQSLTETEYIDLIIPQYRKTYEIINSVPPTSTEPNYVYRIGTFVPYFINDNHQRVYTDDQMDMLACIRSTRTDEETVAELKRQGFRFLVFDLNIPTIDETPNQTLNDKWKSTADFINSSLGRLVIEQEKRNKIVLAEIK